MYLKTKFPRISDVEIKERVTVGPQIRELIQDAKFKYQLTEVYKSSLEITPKCHKHFFLRGGDHKAENYPGKVADLVQYYKATQCKTF